VEKPLSLDVATCEAVEAVASQYPNLVAMVGFVRRFDPSYAHAKAAIDAGNLGRPFLVRSQTCDQNDPEGFFVRFAPTSGGIFMDCSMHVTSTWPAGCSATRASHAPLPTAPSPCTPA
jgi:myo-inositol 2-dehydrogenase/D-chiro-inositol 1-dehydrogenase